MHPKLIIIRGNSGSGKSTTAREVCARLGDDTILVSQDIIRREILYVKDRPSGPTADLIKKIVMHGNEIGCTVVLEGILSKKIYAGMLADLISGFDGNAYVFYMDIDFDETVRRHNTKPNRHEYGVEKLSEWWLEKDTLGVEGEYLIPQDFSVDQAVDFILGKA